MAEAFIAPRACTSLSEDGMLPEILAKRTPWGTPYVASIVIAILSIALAWSGSFTTLAAISAVSRFTQYLPTCLAVIVFRKSGRTVPGPTRSPGASPFR